MVPSIPMASRFARPGPTGKSVDGKGKNRSRDTSASTAGREVEASVPVLRRMARAAFGGRGDEILGLLLVVGGLLTGLSVYLERAGVVGRVVDSGLGWSVGATRVVLPVAMVATGLAMFRERSELGEISKRLPVGR